MSRWRRWDRYIDAWVDYMGFLIATALVGLLIFVAANAIGIEADPATYVGLTALGYVSLLAYVRTKDRSWPHG